MKREWKSPELDELNIVDTYGCQYFEAIGSETKDYPEGTQPGTAGPWCCNCGRGLEGNCNGTQEYINGGGTCAIS